jgi:FG-GAP-like repeat
MRWSTTIVVLVQVAASFGYASDQPAGQLVFSPHLIDDHSPFNASVHACDLDGDGELEIVGASMADDSIHYWKQDGGNPDSWVKQVIGSQFYGATSVYASDLDSDGDLDVIGAADDAGEVAWWRNDGSSPIDWSMHYLTVRDVYPQKVHATDIDLDGDQDVLHASSGFHTITLWLNDGRRNPGWVEQIVGGVFREAKSVTSGDFDGDGRIDVVGGSPYAGGGVVWWRNAGGSPIDWQRLPIDASFSGAHGLQAADVDGDGNLDVVGVSYEGIVSWWRNDGGNPVAWTKQILIEGWYWAGVALAADLDGDGDLDITATSRSPGEVFWWRNDGGRPISWFQQRIATIPGAWALTIVDVDGDGDNDVVAAGRHEVRWYCNEGRMTRVRPSGGRVRP